MSRDKDYQIDYRRESKKQTDKRRFQHSRAGSTNGRSGIHRRRNKRFTW